MIVKLNNRLNIVERRVEAAIRRVDHNYRVLGSKSAKWTRAIKNEVGRLGEKLGFTVYGAQCVFWRNGEWMFDLTWSNENAVYAFRLPLVMEIEWDPTGILWDFCKLLAARADLRVFVFWASTRASAAQTSTKLITQIRRFRGSVAGDRYLFSYWTNQPEKLFIESYVVK